jgi:GT2 family glycosyltransferase
LMWTSNVIGCSPAVSVVICVHGAVDWAERCLEGLLASCIEPLEVIVVDDASRAEAHQRLAAFCRRHPGITLIRLDRRHWYPRAANLGVEAARSETVLLVNSDALISSSAAFELATIVRRRRHAMAGPLSNAAGYQSVPWNETATGAFPICPLPAGVSHRELQRHWAGRMTAQATEVRLVNGFCLAFDRDRFRRLGGFDCAAFPKGYGEEFDLCIRWRHDGGVLLVDPKVYVYHGKTKSFTADERASLIQQARQVLADRYGEDLIADIRRSMREHEMLSRARSEMAALYRVLARGDTR